MGAAGSCLKSVTQKCDGQTARHVPSNLPFRCLDIKAMSKGAAVMYHHHPMSDINYQVNIKRMSRGQLDHMSDICKLPSGLSSLALRDRCRLPPWQFGHFPFGAPITHALVYNSRKMWGKESRLACWWRTGPPLSSHKRHGGELSEAKRWSACIPNPHIFCKSGTSNFTFSMHSPHQHITYLL